MERHPSTVLVGQMEPIVATPYLARYQHIPESLTGVLHRTYFGLHGDEVADRVLSRRELGICGRITPYAGYLGRVLAERWSKGPGTCTGSDVRLPGAVTLTDDPYLTLTQGGVDVQLG